MDTQSVKLNICSRNLTQAERKSNYVIPIFSDSQLVDVAQISSGYEWLMQTLQTMIYSVKLFRSKVLLCLVWIHDVLL